MNTFQATEAPTVLRLAGVDYQVRLLNYRELAEVSAWIDARLPSPLDQAIRAIARARMNGAVDQTTEDAIFDRADEKMKAWPPRPATKAWFEALDQTPGGSAEIIRVILSKTVPGFDHSRAEALADAIEPDDLTALISLGVFGVRPKGEPVPTAVPPPFVAGEWREAPQSSPTTGAR